MYSYYVFELEAWFDLIESQTLKLLALSGMGGTNGKKVLYRSVFDVFPLTYMWVDIDFRLFSD